MDWQKLNQIDFRPTKMSHTAARTLMKPSLRTLAATLFCGTTWRHKAKNCYFKAYYVKGQKNFHSSAKFGPFLKIN